MFKLQNHPQGDFLTLRYEKCDIYILVYIYINLVSITWSKFNSCINVNACWGLMKLLFFILHSILPYIQIFVFKIKFTKKKKKTKFFLLYIYHHKSHSPYEILFNLTIFSCTAVVNFFKFFAIFTSSEKYTFVMFIFLTFSVGLSFFQHILALSLLLPMFS